MSNKCRFIAEWEPSEAVFITWPDADTDWNYILEEAQLQYYALIQALLQTGVKVFILCHNLISTKESLGAYSQNPQLFFIEAEYNDTWIRDYGPLTTEIDNHIISNDFGFNAWGLKFASDKDNLVNLHLNQIGLWPDGVYRNHRDFILEGGSVETDGNGTLLTTSRCLQSPNRNGGKSKEELNLVLGNTLGVSHVLWLDYGALQGDDTDSHIDTLARLAPNDTIIFTGCRNFDDPQFEELLRMRAQLELFRTAEGNPFNLIELPLPSPIFDPLDGSRLPATYANYLIVNDRILMPTYGDTRTDTLAANTLRIAFPSYQIIGVNCKTLLRQHGSLHCATMQIPVGTISPSWLR